METTKHLSILDQVEETEDGVTLRIEEKREGIQSFWRIAVEGETHDLT